MEAVKLNCTYEERISKKDNITRYKCIVIKLADNYEKVVYPSLPEQVLVEQTYNVTQNSTSPYEY